MSWIDRRLGWKTDRSWYVPTHGVVPAITYAVQAFTEPGDGVLIMSPVYYPFKNSCVLKNGRRIEESTLINTDGYYTIDFEDFDARAAKPDVKLFILCSPHNPVGRVWTRDELVKLVDICQHHGVMIFSDEIHSDIVFADVAKAAHTATGLLYDGDWSGFIAAYSPSKTFNLAGLRQSTVVIPDAETRRRYKAQLEADQGVGTTCFAPGAAIAAYDRCEDWMLEMLDYVGANIEYARDFVNSKLKGCLASKTEGTYFLWVDFRGTGLSTEEINRAVLEKAGVAGDLGEWFGPTGAGFVRFNMACPRSTVDEMLKRLASAFS